MTILLHATCSSEQKGKIVMRIFDCVDRRNDEYFEFLKTMVELESYTPDKEAVDRLGLAIKTFATDHGFDVHVEEFEKSGNGLLVTINNGSPLPPVVFTAHMDTVHPGGSWNRLPVWKQEGDRLTGPGTYDMKGGIAVGLLVMQALKDIGYKDRQIRLVLVPDEELSEGLSGEKGKEFIRSNARGCAAAITLESGIQGKITVARKASIRYKVKVLGKSAHAGECYADGISAIKEAGMKICAIEEASDPKDITYNCGMIKGGISPNTVPGECCFTLYNRYWRPDQRQIVKDHVEGILDKSFIPGTRCEWTVVGERPPMDASEGNLALADHLRKVAEEYGFGHYENHRASSGSDAVYTYQAGVPSVCSMGMTGNGAHEKSEFVWVSSLADRAKWISQAVIELPADFGVSREDVK